MRHVMLMNHIVSSSGIAAASWSPASHCERLGHEWTNCALNIVILVVVRSVIQYSFSRTNLHRERPSVSSESMIDALRHVHVAVAGTGFAGLGAAIRMKLDG